MARHNNTPAGRTHSEKEICKRPVPDMAYLCLYQCQQMKCCSRCLSGALISTTSHPIIRSQFVVIPNFASKHGIGTASMLHSPSMGFVQHTTMIHWLDTVSKRRVQLDAAASRTSNTQRLARNKCE
jgi:hypothetical protein